MSVDRVPKVTNVEIVPVDPEVADRRNLAYLRAKNNVALEDVTYLVKLYLDVPLPATGAGLALYIGDTPIAKYWQFAKGIYFNVYDPSFVAAHAGEEIRFSEDRETFIETGSNLPGFPTPAPVQFGLLAANAVAGQPLLSKADALKQ